MTSVSLV
jgi:hypothetical protein